MSNIRDLGQKINSLRNMQKVTRAMNMISSIKLRKLYAIQSPLELFNKKTDEFLSAMLAGLNSSGQPVVSGYEKVEKIHMIMFTGDKGLCGTHNSSVQKAVEKFVKLQDESDVMVEISSIGRKGTGFCRRKGFELFRVADIGDKDFSKDTLDALSNDIFNRFSEGSVQKVFVAGNIFYSALRQETEVRQLLPLEPDDKKTAVTDIQLEPPGEEFAAPAARLYLKYKLNTYLLNSLLSEHSSRMTAMENATNNSEDLINKYVTIQNHVRQAAITNELIEIVSGKEALKG